MASPSQDNELPTGQQRPSSAWGEFNNIGFLVQQAIGKLQTSTLVRVEKCTNSGGISPVGFVDITPLVNQLDGAGNPTPHVTIFNVPYFRMQGGASAIIIDPVVGDIGMAVFASRDITKVKSTRAQGNPGSFRQYSFSDALYLGGLLNAMPSQYVQFSADGIRMHSPTQITLNAPTITMQSDTITMQSDTINMNGGTSITATTPTFTVNGNALINGNTTMAGGVSQTGGGRATFSGSMDVTGDVTAQGTSVHGHIHGGVQSGPNSTNPPS